MTHHDDDEDVLGGIDLQTWHVPPPLTIDRPALLVRALSPATSPAKHPRLAWLLVASLLVSAALATFLVILLARSPAPQTTLALQPAGGTVDAQVRELLVRLQQEQRELERKLAEIKELRALVLELSEKVRRLEQQDGKRDRTAPKPRDRQDPVERPEPEDKITAGSCDEVTCVLSNNPGTCCNKFRRPDAPITDVKPSTDPLIETLTRQSISRGIASVKARVAACADRSTATGTVKVRVKVGTHGRVENVSVDVTPDAVLGACVAAAVQRAVFPRTQNGGSFRYPFVF